MSDVAYRMSTILFHSAISFKDFGAVKPYRSLHFPYIDACLPTKNGGKLWLQSDHLAEVYQGQQMREIVTQRSEMKWTWCYVSRLQVVQPGELSSNHEAAWGDIISYGKYVHNRCSRQDVETTGNEELPFFK